MYDVVMCCLSFTSLMSYNIGPELCDAWYRDTWCVSLGLTILYWPDLGWIPTLVRLLDFLRKPQMIHLMFEASWSSTEAFELSKWFALSERPQFLHFLCQLSQARIASHCKEKISSSWFLDFPKWHVQDWDRRWLGRRCIDVCCLG